MAELRGSVLSLRGGRSAEAVSAGERGEPGSLGSGKRSSREAPPLPGPASSVARGVLPVSESG